MSVRVEEIEVRNFLSHKHTQLTLPPSGVVVVTGPNGAGKSTLMEAVATGLWGQTLRGTSPWNGDGVCFVRATGSRSITASRARKGARTSLIWGEVDQQPADYETTTKAQEALESVVGSWDLWRRTCVFSSADAAHFTLATDAERKRLLENLLGLDKFDDALECCRIDLKAAESSYVAADSASRTAIARAAEAAVGVGRLKASLEGAPPPKPAPTAARVAMETKLDGLRRTAQVAAMSLRGRIEHERAGAGGNAATIAGLERQLAKVASGTCNACGQVIPPATGEKLRTEIAEEKRKAAEADVALEASTAGLRDELREAEEDIADLDKRLRELRAALAAEEANARALAARTRAEEQLADAVAGQAALDAKVLEARKLVEERAALHAELKATEKVLGMKGVRAHVLGTALTGVERVANGWLARIAGSGLTLALKPYVEKKSGGMSDAIGLEVSGAGGGNGYQGSSGGERRRIDVALLLALAEVSQAASGAAADSTLWFDEVFDALDGDGVDAVASALRDLATRRTVVVVTHSESLSARVDAAVRLRVEDGHLGVR